jgi:arsenate reductase (thioredoxin)
MTDRAFNVVFLCTGNSGRSILAEAILRKVGRRPLQAYAAGSHPKFIVNPFASKNLKAWAARPKGCGRRAGRNSPAQMRP